MIYVYLSAPSLVFIKNVREKNWTEKNGTYACIAQMPL